MMSVESRLKTLQCHFNWDLDVKRYKLLHLMYKLEDIGTEEGKAWLGHIYNLQGFIHYEIGNTDEARSFFVRAAEAFKQMRRPGEGPWLVVNYGNKAWLHYRQGEEAESQYCLLKVDRLMNEHVSPYQDELHPEIYAEKAWTLMKFNRELKLLAADCFQRAIRMQPEMVEWQTSYILCKAKYCNTDPEADFLEEMKESTNKDPENLYLAAFYFERLGRTGENIQDKAQILAEKVLENPVSSYSGLKMLLKIYKYHISIDEGVQFVEKALEKHPHQRYVKRCAALAYRWKILFSRNSLCTLSDINRGIQLQEEVITLYPFSAFVKTMELASLYASQHNMDKADQIYEELLRCDLDPADRQVFCNMYAKYLYFFKKDPNTSIQYHMEAASIPLQDYFQQDSIRILVQIKDRGRSHMCQKIEKLLANVQQQN